MTPRILIAGIGNIFRGDDRFGVDVAARLAQRPLPEGVRVVDIGIRGLDLAYALMDDWDAVILVDAAPRGEPPGTLYLIEPQWPITAPDAGEPVTLETHGMDPARVLRLVHAMGGCVRRIYLVGCEPRPGTGDEDMNMDVSPQVQAAVDEAIAMIESLITRITQDIEPAAAVS